MPNYTSQVKAGQDFLDVLVQQAPDHAHLNVFGLALPNRVGNTTREMKKRLQNGCAFGIIFSWGFLVSR